MSVQNVLVIGGGITGSFAAIGFAQHGAQVTLIERSPEWYGVGHGITVQGNALRSFQKVGLLEKVLAKGQPFNEMKLSKADGELMARVPVAHTGGEDLPSTLGALRSDLQTVLVDEIHRLGIEVRLGTEVVAVDNSSTETATVTFNTGGTETYDLVVAADGIKSSMRPMLGYTEEKAPSGMGIWRVVTKRTPEMDCSGMAYFGPEYKAGYTPISKDLCYAFVLTKPERPDNGLSDAQEIKRLLEGYHGDFDFIRENISEDDFMSFQPIEWVFIEGPWWKNRVVLIGDAVHACPPLIAQGAAQCSEDALVLVEEVMKGGDYQESMQRYDDRRKPRIKLVLNASLQLVDWEIHPDTPGADPGKLMAESLAALAANPA